MPELLSAYNLLMDTINRYIKTNAGIGGNPIMDPGHANALYREKAQAAICIKEMILDILHKPLLHSVETCVQTTTN